MFLTLHPVEPTFKVIVMVGISMENQFDTCDELSIKSLILATKFLLSVTQYLMFYPSK